MTDFNTDINARSYNFEPAILIHELSESEIYVGVSNNGGNVTASTWQIKKSVKIGDIWKINLFPDGDQSFSYVWNNRLTYTYI